MNNPILVEVLRGTLAESLANALTASNSLTVSGGTANLSFANNYTGATTVSAGTLTASLAGAA